MSEAKFSLLDLEKIIAERASASPNESWTAKLVSSGIERASKKLGEEAIETVIASVAGQRTELASEAADLLFHLLVVLKISDVSVQSVMDELERRTGTSGIAEKASRKSN